MKDLLITNEYINEYSFAIPPVYMQRIKEGELMAVASVDDYHEDELVGVSVVGERDGWAEILNLFLTETYMSVDYASDLIRSLRFDLPNGSVVNGLFAELAIEDDDDVIEDAFRYSGFDVSTTDGNVLSFPLSRVADGKIASGIGSDILFLKDADEGIKRKINLRLKEEEKDVPIELPVEWDRYDKNLSMIRMEGNEPAGLLLVERVRESISVSLAYDNGAGGLLKMIGALITRGKEAESPETEIVVPIVEEKLFPFVEKLVPDAERSKVMCAYWPAMGAPKGSDIDFLAV